MKYWKTFKTSDVTCRGECVGEELNKRSAKKKFLETNSHAYKIKAGSIFWPPVQKTH